MFENFIKKFTKSNKAQENTNLNPVELIESFLINTKKTDDPFDETYDTLKESFAINDEYGEHIDDFNNGSAMFFNLPKVHRGFECSGEYGNETCVHELKYKDKFVTWQEQPSFISDEFEIFMLSKLVADDIDIRFDELTAASSEHNWYALPQQEWHSLEDNFGKTFVQNYFSSMPDKFTENILKFDLIDSNIGSVFF